MKIEFRKVPFNEKSFETSFDSVKLEGTFCRISPTLAKINAVLVGEATVDCCRCGDEYKVNMNEELDFLLSDGVYSKPESDDLVFEIENGIIDFDALIESELSSLRSDYHICDKCANIANDIEKEY